MNRIVRIKIPYIASMIVICIISVVTIWINADAFLYYDAFNLKTFIGNIFMLQNNHILSIVDMVFGTNIKMDVFSSARPFWTLAIEWWIYMSAGYFWLYLRKVSKVSLWNVTVMIILSIVPLYNLILGGGNGLTWVWLGGVTIGTLYRQVEIESKFLKYMMVLVSFSILIGAALIFKDAYSAAVKIMILITLFWILVLFKDDNRSLTGNLGTAIIKHMAGYRYSLYLLHYSIIKFISIALAGISIWVQILLAILISNMCAYLCSVWFERKDSPVVSWCTKKLSGMLKV